MVDRQLGMFRLTDSASLAVGFSVAGVSDPGSRSVPDSRDDAMSVTLSQFGEDDLEDEELEAAADHLHKVLYSDALPRPPEEAGGDRDRDQDRDQDQEQAITPRQPSLALLLGPLPTAASLGLTESIQECIDGKKEDGERSAPVPACPLCSLLPPLQNTVITPSHFSPPACGVIGLL